MIDYYEQLTQEEKEEEKKSRIAGSLPCQQVQK